MSEEAMKRAQNMGKYVRGAFSNRSKKRSKIEVEEGEIHYIVSVKTTGEVVRRAMFMKEDFSGYKDFRSVVKSALDLEFDRGWKVDLFELVHIYNTPMMGQNL